MPSLGPGVRIGSYEIVSAIGAGGMGEVYRARDTKLGREVAIKVLPSSLTSDPERLARFRREAQVLATLSHPNIAGIYHVEETADGPAIVMELVDGETLADRIARGPIPIDEALPIAKQIAEALEAAHEQGIIHRDLKPANITLTPNGTVKVLDFGLAKLNDPNVSNDPNGPNVLSMSPTITSPALLTGVGMLLGTAAYMSPEQAKGKPADKRSDIWAFGCVLYEMLTGRRAFEGEDILDVMGGVVRLDPNWDALSSDVPHPLRTLMQKCLAKDRRRRISDIAAASFAIEAMSEVSANAAASPRTRNRLWQRIGIPVSMFLLGTAAAGGFVLFAVPPLSTIQPVTRLAMPASVDAPVAYDGADRILTVSPDGSRIVYTSANVSPYVNGIPVRLFARKLDQLQNTLLAGPGDVRDPFFSPDGEWVGFFDPITRIQKVGAAGGPPIALAAMDGNARGATWGPDDTIIFATVNTATGLQRISTNGGEPTILTRPNHEKGERDHVWPYFLPGGHAVLFTILPVGPIEDAQIAVLDLRDGKQKVLVRGGSDARYVPGGFLVYGFAGTLRAVAFDAERLEVRGTPVPVLQQVVTTPVEGAANFGVAGNGTLIYASGTLTSAPRTRSLVWVDREGRAIPVFEREAVYRAPRLSPDGKRVAVDVTSVSTSGAPNRDIWVIDIGPGTQTRLTSEPGIDSLPLWTRDGKAIVFSSDRAGGASLLYSVPADGSKRPESLTKGDSSQGATSWSPDGRTLAFYDVRGPYDMFTLTLGAAPIPYSQTSFREQGPTFSPDGRWIAYSSNETGRDEIYIAPYPGPGGRIAVSTGGGRAPRWAPNGRELFFRNDRQMMAVTVDYAGPTLKIAAPRLLFDGDFVQEDVSQGAQNYDVSVDGQRFLMIREAGSPNQADAPPPQILVVQHFDEELKRLVPTK